MRILYHFNHLKNKHTDFAMLTFIGWRYNLVHFYVEVSPDIPEASFLIKINRNTPSVSASMLIHPSCAIHL